MATSDRAQEFLRSLAPFEKLEQSTRLLIQALKHEFPYQNALKSHLTELGVPRLADYLVWIPHHRFEEDMEEIGRGGFGTVHKATVEAFDERGFKTLHKNGDELVYDKNFVRTFALKEVDISIIVPELIMNVFLLIKSWPGTIVRLVGLSQHQETKKYILVFDYAHGGNLEQNNHPEPKDWIFIMHLATDLAENLNQFHVSGITHNDLHPGNLVFLAPFVSSLIDVGLSKSIQDAREEEGAYGRLQYLPPEVFEDKPYDSRSDIYCLGTLLWQLVTRVPPRLVTSTEAVNTRPDRLREDLIPGAPEEFNAVIRDCWNPDPSLRPDASEVYGRLQSLRYALLTGDNSERPSDVGDTWEWLQKSIKYSSAAPRTESYPLSAETTTFLSNLRVAYAKEQAKNRALGKVISSKSAPLHQQPLTRSQFHTRASLRAISQQWSRGALQAAATATSQTNASTAKAIENEPEPSVSTKKKKQQSVRFKVEELQTYRPRRNRRYSLPLV